MREGATQLLKHKISLYAHTDSAVTVTFWSSVRADKSKVIVKVGAVHVKINQKSINFKLQLA